MKSPVKALGLYNFVRGFGRAYRRWSLYPGGTYKWNKKEVSEGQDKTYLRNELKLTYHYIYSCYIYNTFIVRHSERRIYFKNVYTTPMWLKLLQGNKTKVHKLQAVMLSIRLFVWKGPLGSINKVQICISMSRKKEHT